MKLATESQDFINLLKSNEEWLMGRIAHFARNNNSASTSSVLQEVFQSSIRGMTESLILAVKMHGIVLPEWHSDESVRMDPISLFAQSEAKKHKHKGISLSMFLSLLKYYKQSYCDLIQQARMSNSREAKYILFIVRCFDRIEMGFIAEWTSTSSEEIIGELHASNRLVSQENNRYLRVFESLFSPVIVLDEKKNILDLNLEAAKLFRGIKISGKLSTQNKLSAPLLQLISDQVDKLVATREMERIFEAEIENEDGKRYFKLILKKILDLNEQYKGTIIMLQDLTEQYITAENLKEAKLRAEEADKLKTSFLANMSHEIRTPMNAIVGFTELLLNENYKLTEQKDFLKLIQSSSRDLLHIIEDIIDIAKLESKQLKIKYKPCKIYDILTDLHAVFSETLRRYGTDDDISLRLVVAEKDRDRILLTDGERLKQVITNFLSNAAKFTNKGYIEFGYRPVDESNLIFFVRDSGTGIPEDMKERVFERFFQLEEHQSMNVGGAGLGLAICKNIVSLLGGKIWMESSVGKGSDFYFQLPIHEGIVKQTPVGNTSRKIGQTSIDLANKCILIAEDDEMNFLFLEEIFSRTGAEILRAENGLEAINIAESREHIDLILMDIKMPEVDGIEASKYITAIRPDIPIIAQTAFAMDGDKTRCLNAGCSAYITKPIERHKLFLLIERYLLSKSISVATSLTTK